jgi:hypothetical protein
MRKWIKRTLLAIASLLCAAAVLSASGVLMFKAAPAWYHPRGTGSPQERAAAAERAEAQIEQTHNWAAKVKADEDKVLYARRTGAAAPTTRATDPLTITFTEQELSAFFDKWSTAYHWSDKYAAYIEDPAIVLRDGRLILAAKVKELGAIASFQFRPALDATGRLRLELVRVMGGRLPLPDAVWTPQRDKIASSLRRNLPMWQGSAKIEENGASNFATMAASLSRLFLGALHRQAVDPILFLPLVDQGKSVPVRLTQLDIDDARLTMTVVPLNPAERVRLLNRIRSPDEGGIIPTVAAPQ